MLKFLKYILFCKKDYRNNKDEFIKLPDSASIYHTFQQDENENVINVLSGSEKGYTKFIHPKYGYEVVLDGNGNIVTNPTNIETYNFYNPHLGIDIPLIEDKDGIFNKNLGNHKKYDVDPYFFKGNSEEDKTTPRQRKLRLIYSIKEKIKENGKKK